MANANQSGRGIQLIRTEDNLPLQQVSFYDRRETDVRAAFIGTIHLPTIAGEAMTSPAIVKAALHGYTQNVLDSSNKLTGDERVAFIRKACETINAGGWASAPQDEGKIRENAISALVKLGFSQSAAEATVAKMGQ